MQETIFLNGNFQEPRLENLMEEKVDYNLPTTLMITTTETPIGTITEEYPSIVNENLTTTTTSEGKTLRNITKISFSKSLEEKIINSCS